MVSPVALRTESSTADAFSPTCPYLQKRRGGEHLLSGFDFPTTVFALFGTVLVVLDSLWNDYSTRRPAPFVLFDSGTVGM